SSRSSAGGNVTTTAQLRGRYTHDRDQHFDKFLEAQGVNWVLRTVATNTKPDMEVNVIGDKWTLITHVAIKTLTWHFRIGKEAVIRGPDGTDQQAIFLLHGNTLVQENIGGVASNVKVERHFTKKGMEQVMTHLPSNTVGIRFFKRETTTY
ncbi:unnamed protein product, partial [Meganyctiphanes norvegica]